MNCCGYEKHITSRFLESDDEDPFELMLDYNFSEWYEVLTPIVHTPKSYIFDYNSLIDNGGTDIDTLIEKMPNQHCFARLDMASSKPKAPYTSAKDILESFQQSDRCRPFLGSKLILREYKTLTGGEFRCFIHNKTFRAITSELPLSPEVIKEVQDTVDKITFYTDYTSYCVDFTFDHDCDDRLMMIEINTPVWLFATSGLYDLEEGYDYSVLLGEYQPDLIRYPVIRSQVEYSNEG